MTTVNERSCLPGCCLLTLAKNTTSSGFGPPTGAAAQSAASGRLCMFKCQLCGVQVPGGVPVHRMVVASRNRIYPRREKAHSVVETETKRGLRKRVDDPGGQGTEIVREIEVCPDYAPGPS